MHIRLWLLRRPLVFLSDFIQDDQAHHATHNIAGILRPNRRNLHTASQYQRQKTGDRA